MEVAGAQNRKRGVGVLPIVLKLSKLSKFHFADDNVTVPKFAMNDLGNIEYIIH
jgi:hypothetical protein